MLSKSAKSILWPRYGAPEVAKNEKFSPPYYHHIVFLIHPLSQLRYPAHTLLASNIDFYSTHFLLNYLRIGSLLMMNMLV